MPCCLAHLFTQRNKRWHPSWGFSQNLDFPKRCFFQCFRSKTNITHCRTHEMKTKIMSKITNIANIIVQYKGIVQCFLTQRLGQILFDQLYCIVPGLGIHSFVNNAMFLRSFPFFIKELNVFCILFHSL